MNKYCVVILILDGCNINALKKAKIPCIRQIMKEGTFVLSCKSVYPTVTYTAHCSLVTGTHPDHHGIVGNCFYDKTSKRVVDFDIEDVNEYLLSKTLFEKIQGLKIAVGEPISRGSDFVIPKSIIQSKKLMEQDVFSINSAKGLIIKHKPLLTVINLPGIDTIGELYGPMSREVLDHLNRLDQSICELKSSLERVYDDFLLIILADHGMTSIKENISLNRVLNGLNVKICVSHRMAHIYVISGNVADVISRLEADGRFEAIIQYEELYKYHLKNPRSGDIVVIAKEGYELGPKPLKGSHGGISPNEIYVPLIVNKPEYIDLLKKDVNITIVPKIITRYFLEMGAINIAKDRLRFTDPAHGWSHTIRVLNLATKLAIRYNADIEAVRISCIFHDVARGLKPENHEKRGVSLAEEYLRKQKCSEEFISKVKRIILKHHSDSKQLETIEEKILWDADKLDALGLIGLSRCLIEAGFFRQSINDAVNHLLGDIKEFKDRMHFKETKKLANIRISTVLDVIKKLKKELKELE